MRILLSSLLSLTFLAIIGLGFSSPVCADNTDSMQTKEDARTQSATPQEKIKPFDNESPLLAVRKREKTTSLQVASIFHRQAGTKPDFKAWAENNPKYDDALDIDKQDVFTKVYNRFVRAFHELDENMIINVQTRLRLGEYSKLQSILVLDDFHEKTFFRYDAYGEFFALIPNNIKQFHHIRMNADRYKTFQDANGDRHEVIAEIYLKLQKIDPTQPHELEDGHKFWLMLGDIAEIRFWSLSKEDPKLLWRYQAEWYDGYVNSELMKLYSGQNDQGISAP